MARPEKRQWYPLALAQRRHGGLHVVYGLGYADWKRAQQALLYTLLSTCKQHGVNPEAWLTDVLNRMYKHPVNRLAELLPQNWKPAEQPEPEKEKAKDA
jgi:hypothetical protein